MIDIRKLKELVRLMVANELTELDLRDTEEQVTLRRDSQSAGAGAAEGSVGSGTAGSRPVAVAEGGPRSAEGGGEEGLLRVESPMVGTFYSAANPDALPYVHAGTAVGPETVVCMIEAMKIFNEIKAECSGTIERVLVKNGDAVEFGQAIFLVKPS